VNYLQWLAGETATAWWHDSAILCEIDAAVGNGAMGVTTNPVLVYRSLTEDPQTWEKHLCALSPDDPPEAHAEQLLRIVTTAAARRFLPLYQATEGKHGYALCQVNPERCSDSSAMLEQALRYVGWAENIAVKLPAVQAALPVIEALSARGTAVCVTLNFSVSQALASARAYERGAARCSAPRPCFVVQQGDRLSEYIRDIAADSRLALPDSVLMRSGTAVCRRSYELFGEYGLQAKIMPAGLRGIEMVTELAGADMVFSLQRRVAQMILAADPPKREMYEPGLPDETAAALASVPEFVRAYDENGMEPAEFITFGVLQRTLSQFLWTGWAPLEQYRRTASAKRWF